MIAISEDESDNGLFLRTVVLLWREGEGGADDETRSGGECVNVLLSLSLDVPNNVFCKVAKACDNKEGGAGRVICVELCVELCVCEGGGVTELLLFWGDVVMCE